MLVLATETSYPFHGEAEASPIRQAWLCCFDPFTDRQQIPVQLAIID